jgi:PAS domain S-box-containing protein
MAIQKDDKRIQLVLDQIIKFTQNDFQACPGLSPEGDEIDAIIAGLNALGDELKAKEDAVKKDKERISSLMDILLKYTTMDFSSVANITERGDEIDAIALGLNTLSDELQYNLKKVKENEEKFRKIFELNPAGISLFDFTNGKIIDINDSYLKLIGYSREEVVGSQAMELGHMESEERKTMYEEYKQNHSLKNKEFVITPKTGEKRTVLFSVEPVYINDEQLMLSIVYDISKRKVAEEQLREREEQIKTIFNAAPDAVVVIDGEGNITKWNPKAEQIFGWKEIEVINKPLHEFIIPKFYQETHLPEKINFLKIAEDKEFKNKGEMAAINKQGKEIIVSLGVSPTYINGKKAYINFLRDITELKKSEKKAKENEERFRITVENVKDYAIIILDIKGNVLTWNKGAERITGYNAAEIINRNFSVFYTEEEKQRNEPEYNLKIAKENGRYECETWRVRKDGSRFFADVINTALYDDQNKLRGFAKITRDITERKEVEEKIKRAATQLSASQAMAHIGSWEWDIVNNTITWSDELYRIYGLVPQQFSVSFGSADKFIHPADKALVNKTARAAYRSKKSFILDYKIIRTDGILRTINERAEIVKDKEGRPVKMFGTVHDITEQKQAEDEIIKKSEELARSNAELEQFAYVASHDLQEPLRMITSYVQLLEKNYKNKLDQDARDFIDFAVDGASRMRTLIYSLLEYSRVNRIKPFESINPCKILNDVIKDLDVAIKESNAKITWDKLPLIRGDTVLIGQLFFNLIANAIKFRSARPLEINIEGKKTNGEYLFSVKDNGIGIKKEYSEKIFIIFQRLHTKDKYPGTGIGLAICKKIVEKHGGRIWIESEENNGTTFYFTIKGA